MPKKSRLENILFTLVMAFVMVYAMVCYNIAIDKGGMTNEVFLLAFHEIPIMWPIACILEYFVVEKLATMLAFRLVNPKEDKPVFVTLAICSMIVCLMCPVMSHCSEVWVFGEIVSAGMDAEIRRAKRKNYRLRYFGSDLKEVTENA